VTSPVRRGQSLALLSLLISCVSCTAASTQTVTVEDTIGWGCPCPPYVLASAKGEVTSDDQFLYPSFLPGVRVLAWPPADGRYRLTGRYTGETINRYQWAKRVGDKPPGRGDGREYYEKRHPVFEVSGWCVVSWEGFDDEMPFDVSEMCPK
jgi:hypothetical protein